MQRLLRGKKNAMVDVLMIAYLLIIFSAVMQRYKETNKTVSFRIRRSRPHSLPCLCVVGAALAVCTAAHFMGSTDRSYTTKSLVFHGLICGAPLFIQLFVPLKKGSGIEARIREFRRARAMAGNQQPIEKRYAGEALDAVDPNPVKVTINDHSSSSVQTKSAPSSSSSSSSSVVLHQNGANDNSSDDDTEDEFVAAANIPDSLGLSTDNVINVLPISISLSIVLGVIIVFRWRKAKLNELPLTALAKAFIVLIFYSTAETMLFCSYVHRTVEFLLGYVPAVVISALAQSLCCFLCFSTKEAGASFWMILLSSFATQTVFGSTMGNTFSVWPAFSFFSMLGATIIESPAKGYTACMVLSGHGFGMALCGMLFFIFCCAGLAFWVLQIFKKQKLQKTPSNPLTSFFSGMKQFRFHV